MRLFPLNSSPSSSSELTDRKRTRTLLYLNVYDLTPVNNYLYWFGFGVFHSGIEVHGMEYGFGAHEYSSSGVFEVEPRSCFMFRRLLLLGSTDMSCTELWSFMEQLSGKYHGDTYHLIAKNCNHFSNEVCLRLTGKPIPGWVNRLARVGSFCNCLLPENIQLSAVRHLPDHPSPYSDDNDDDDDDGSESIASSGTESEGSNHQLLNAPIGDIAFVKETPVRVYNMNEAEAFYVPFRRCRFRIQSLIMPVEDTLSLEIIKRWSRIKVKDQVLWVSEGMIIEPVTFSRILHICTLDIDD